WPRLRRQTPWSRCAAPASTKRGSSTAFSHFCHSARSPAHGLLQLLRLHGLVADSPESECLNSCEFRYGTRFRNSRCFLSRRVCTWGSPFYVCLRFACTS